MTIFAPRDTRNRFELVRDFQNLDLSIQLDFRIDEISQSLKVFASFASLIRQFANRLIAKEERSKRKLWRNLKLSAFVVGAAPWLIPDPESQSKNFENELTASECKFSLTFPQNLI